MTHIAPVFGDDLFAVEPAPLSPLDGGDEFAISLAHHKPHARNTAVQLRRALTLQRQRPLDGVSRAELMHKYAELVDRARHFDRSIAEKLIAHVKNYRQRRIVQQAPPRKANELDATERLAKRIALRDFEDDEDRASVWNTGLSSPFVPPHFGTPLPPSVPQTGDWLTPNGSDTGKPTSTAIKRLFCD